MFKDLKEITNNGVFKDAGILGQWRGIDTAPRDEYLMLKTPFYECVGFFDTEDNVWFFPRFEGEYIPMEITPTHWQPEIEE